MIGISFTAWSGALAGFIRIWPTRNFTLFLLVLVTIVGVIVVMRPTRMGTNQRDVGPSLARGGFIADGQQSMVELAERRRLRDPSGQPLDMRIALAGYPFSAADWIVIMIGSMLAVFVVTTLLFGLLAGLVMGPAVGFGGLLHFRYRLEKRRLSFVEQLPETVGLIASSMRAGMSLVQGLDSVSNEAPEPMREELDRVLSQQRLGRDLTAAMWEMADRVTSVDFDWVVASVEIHRRVGGDLAEVLDRVAETIRSREQVRRKVNALTSEGRLSGAVILCMPPALLALMTFARPSYVNVLYETPQGRMVLVGAFFLLASGAVWIRAISRLRY